MQIEYTDNLSVKMCRESPHKIFVFGDNLAGFGEAGQAVIRKEPNAFGIPTKRYPSTHIGAYFKDSDCEKEHVLNALRVLYSSGKNRTIVFPSKGIGSGMAKMPQYSPRIFAEMNAVLLKHFGIRNV